MQSCADLLMVPIGTSTCFHTAVAQIVFMPKQAHEAAVQLGHHFYAINVIRSIDGMLQG